MKISACWIVKNEAASIARSIESLREAVDELIVVDTGSTDETVEVAKSLGAKTDCFEWISDFSAARNHALSLATGDLIFFLDADEWFEPKLDKEQRRILEQLFTDAPKLEGLYVPIRNLDMQTNLLIDKTVVIRVFRNREDIRYCNKIHEAVRKSGNKTLTVITMETWNLNHSGYTPNLMQEKMKRNARLLEEAVEANPDNPDIAIQYFYLMRENYNTGDYEKSFKYFLKVQHDREGLKRFCGEFGAMAAHYFYIAMSLAAIMRNKVSRRDIYDTLVVTMKKLLPDYPGSETIQLVYQSRLDLKEDRFMKELESSIKAAGKKKGDMNSHFKDAQAALFANAAFAAQRRGNREQTFEYAYASFTQSESFINYEVMGALLRCLKGQPEADIILFLNSIFDVSNEEKRGWMIKSLQMEGYATLYIYYLKKQLEQGTVATDSYLLLLILLGRYEEAVKTGISQYEEAQGVVRDSIFLAAICSGQESIYRDNLQYLEGFGHILEAYFGGSRLPNITQNDGNILLHHYKFVAFAAGRKRAEQLLDVFRAAPQLCFLAKAQYCVHNGLFEEVLKEDTSFLQKNDFKSYELMVRSYSAVGRYGEALSILESFLKIGFLSMELFNWILVICEKAEKGIREKARGIYDSYIIVYDEILDLRDVVNTKIVYDDSSKKQARALKHTTPEQFKKLADKDVPPILHGELLKALLGAAAVYEEKELYTTAQQCYRRLYACNYEMGKTREGLARVFEKLGNKELAAWFAVDSAP